MHRCDYCNRSFNYGCNLQYNSYIQRKEFKSANNVFDETVQKRPHEIEKRKHGIAIHFSGIFKIMVYTIQCRRTANIALHCILEKNFNGRIRAK